MHTSLAKFPINMKYGYNSLYNMIKFVLHFQVFETKIIHFIDFNLKLESGK